MSDPNAAGPWHHSAFYRFVAIPDPQATAKQLRELGQRFGIEGSILLAHEGINGAVAGNPAAVPCFEAALTAPAVLQGALQGMVFKRSTGLTRPFARLKVSVKPEIVALDLPQAGDLSAIDEQDSSHLSPLAWRELLAAGQAVVLDNRNHFEFRLGHFAGAVDPQVTHFKDFVAFVEEQAPRWRQQGRPVAMYCTGGIRCDKTAPWMRSLGLEVFQLDGGILNYLQQLPDAHKDWQGECFVFDNRTALDSRLQESSTPPEAVYDPLQAEEAWRLARARRLADDVT
jgi:UPF0176 protein